jgi:hypothetical protein
VVGENCIMRSCMVCTLHPVLIKVRRMRCAGHVGRNGEVRGAYNILVGKPEGRRPLGRPKRRWEDNIKMDLREIGFGNVD